MGQQGYLNKKKGAGRQRDEGEAHVVLEDGVEHRGKPDGNHGDPPQRMRSKKIA